MPMFIFFQILGTGFALYLYPDTRTAADAVPHARQTSAGDNRNHTARGPSHDHTRPAGLTHGQLVEDRRHAGRTDVRRATGGPPGGTRHGARSRRRCRRPRP